MARDEKKKDGVEKLEGKGSDGVGGVDSARGRRRVMIIDDHVIVRQGLTHLINQERDLTVCGEAEDGLKGLSEADRLLPDVLLLDISLPGMNGIEFIKNVKARHPDLPIVVLSMHDESLYAERALRAGALGYLMKKSSSDEVIAALRKVLNGEFYLSGQTGSALLKKFLGGAHTQSLSPVSVLSDRELEVFEMIGRGKTTRELADALHLSTKTIDAHRMHIKEKLNIHSVTELIQHAVRYVENESAG